LCLRLLQPLAQALDVFIVRLALLLVLYRVSVAAGLWLLFAVFIVVGFLFCSLVG
jgi:hypothetical protein